MGPEQGTEPILAEKLVKIIETHADDIAATWYRDLRESEYTPTIKTISEAQALEMATSVYKKLGYWLLPTSDHEVQRTYERYGEMMYRKKFRMEEVVMILILIKRYLWLRLLEEGIMSTNLDLYKALDLNNKVVLYFDRAIYFALIGFRTSREEAQARKKRVMKGA